MVVLVLALCGDLHTKHGVRSSNLASRDQDYFPLAYKTVAFLPYYHRFYSSIRIDSVNLVATLQEFSYFLASIGTYHYYGSPLFW
jgi:hypothetical protein